MIRTTLLVINAASLSLGYLRFLSAFPQPPRKRGVGVGKNQLQSPGVLTWTMVLYLRNVGLSNVFFTHSVAGWQHRGSPPSLPSLILILPLPLHSPLSHCSSFLLLLLLHLPSLLFLIEIGLFFITLLSPFYLAFNCHGKIHLVSSPNWNYILAFKKLLSRIRVGPWGKKMCIGAPEATQEKKSSTEFSSHTPIFYPYLETNVSQLVWLQNPSV